MSSTRSLWDKVASNLQEWYSDAREWTGEKARIGVKKVDMVGIQHNIKRTMTHLGGRVYDLLQRGEDISMDIEVKRLFATLQGLEQEMTEREQEIDELKVRRHEEPVATVSGEQPALPSADAVPGPNDATDSETKPT